MPTAAPTKSPISKLLLVSLIAALAGQGLTFGQRVANNTLTLPSALPAGEFDTETAYWYDAVLTISSPPGETNQLYFGERNGRIRVVSDIAQDVAEAELFLDIRNRVTTNSENGLLGFAFHPNYSQNGYFYVFYTTNASGQPTDRLSRFTRSDENPLIADSSSELILFDQRDEAGNHNGGDIHFGPDGYLYVAVGDEGGANDSHQNGQFVDKDLFAGMLRLDVDKLPGNIEPTTHDAIPTYGDNLAAFSIPADNPLVERWENEGANRDSKLRLEFYAIGLRNPWRFSFDPATGDLWVADVGQGQYEEIDLVVKGGNYGWPLREGMHDFPRSRELPEGFTAPIDPIHEYGRNLGQSITGGFVYRGAKLPELYGAYVFGDFQTGRVWTLFRGENGTPNEVTEILSAPFHFAYGIDPSNGDILISQASGAIERIVRGADAPPPAFPETLSATGAFSDLETLAPEPGIYAYEPNVSFWSDHAIKSRWFTIPDPEQIGYSQDQAWIFPQASTWIKHFELEMERGNPETRKRVETRFLVKTQRGVYGLSYQWNEAGSEATLVPEEGASIDYLITVDGETTQQTWDIPSRQHCQSCHTEAAGFALSFNTRQLNHTVSIDSQERNILAYLSEIGILDTMIVTPEELPRYYAADDSSATLEQRARSYLSVNCISCHQPNAGAPLSWDARPFLSIGETGLLNGIASNDGGDPTRRLIIRGASDRSIVLDRIGERNGFARMPPIGSNVHDVSSINLLTEWIDLTPPSEISFSDWQILHFGGPESTDAHADADPDNDGNSNRLEYLNRTLPLDSNSFWRPDFNKQGDALHIRFPMSPGRSFVIQTSDDLSAWTDWQVDGNPPQADELEMLNATVDGTLKEESDQSYFRIAVDE